MQHRKTVQTVDSYAERGTAQPQPEHRPSYVTRTACRRSYLLRQCQPLPAQPAPMDGFNVPSPATSNVELRTSYDRSGQRALYGQ
jgi:hypothetical protein